MTLFKRITAFVLVIMMCLTNVTPVSAAVNSQDGVTVTMTMDKESYSIDEKITATIKLKNNNYYAVTDISLDEIGPTGQHDSACRGNG